VVLALGMEQGTIYIGLSKDKVQNFRLMQTSNDSKGALASQMILYIQKSYDVQYVHK